MIYEKKPPVLRCVNTSQSLDPTLTSLNYPHSLQNGLTSKAVKPPQRHARLPSTPLRTHYHEREPHELTRLTISLTLSSVSVAWVTTTLFPSSPRMVSLSTMNRMFWVPLIQNKGQWQPRPPRKRVNAKLREANNVYDLPSIEQGI
jgi:hypothetical protein